MASLGNYGGWDSRSGLVATVGEKYVAMDYTRSAGTQLFDVGSYRVPAVVLPGHAICLCISPNGAFLARVTEKPREILLHEVLGGGPLVEPTRLVSSVSRVGVRVLVFTGDSRFLCALYADNTLDVWRAGEENAMAHHSLPEGMKCMAASPKGALVAVGDKSGSIRIWDVEHGKIVVTFGDSGIPVTALAFSPGSPLLAVAEGRNVRLWDTNSWRLTPNDLCAYKGDPQHSYGPINGLDFAPDGSELLAKTSSAIHCWYLLHDVWHNATGEGTHDGYHDEALAYFPSGKAFLCMRAVGNATEHIAPVAPFHLALRCDIPRLVELLAATPRAMPSTESSKYIKCLAEEVYTSSIRAGARYAVLNALRKLAAEHDAQNRFDTFVAGMVISCLRARCATRAIPFVSRAMAKEDSKKRMLQLLPHFNLDWNKVMLRTHKDMKVSDDEDALAAQWKRCKQINYRPEQFPEWFTYTFADADVLARFFDYALRDDRIVCVFVRALVGDSYSPDDSLDSFLKDVMLSKLRSY